MADDLSYTPGSGATVATDEIGGRHFQRVKLAQGGDGVAVDVSSDAPLETTITRGELIEALEALRFYAASLSRSVGQSLPDVSGRLRVAVESIAAAQTLATVTTVGTVTTVTTVATVTTVGTVSNQTQIGGQPAVEQIPALMRMAADALRRNISVT